MYSRHHNRSELSINSTKYPVKSALMSRYLLLSLAGWPLHRCKDWVWYASESASSKTLYITQNSLRPITAIC